jgi:hypothetical protein
MELELELELGLEQLLEWELLLESPGREQPLAQESAL